MTVSIYTIELRIKAPFLFPGTPFGSFGLDRIGIRDAQGKPVIPRDQIKGIVRHGLQELGRADILNALFGAQSGDIAPVPHGSEQQEVDGANLTPKRAQIIFSDLIGDKVGRRDLPPYPRVSLGEDSGAADPGKIMTAEQMFLPGEEVTFTGRVHVRQPCNDLAAPLELALKVAECIGAMKSIGFGEIINTKVIKKGPPAKPIGVPEGDVFKWTFSLDRPYLIDAERVSENTFLGRYEIPGGVLKGMIAEALTAMNGPLRQAQSDALTDLMISFAKPPSQRRLIPASLVWDRSSGRLFDLATGSQPAGNISWQNDWKPGDEANLVCDKHFGPAPEPNREYRIHTRIDPTSGAAKDNSLFATIALNPPKDGFEVILDMRRVAVDQRSFLSTVFPDMLCGLGRTDAILETRSLEPIEVEKTEIAAGRISLILETPGLLADYSDGNGCARTAYQEFWKTVLPNSDLISHYARQRLIGGYQASRFGIPGKFRPFLITEAGAVFTFDLDPADVGRLGQKLDSGLCRKKLGAISLNWQNCPFVAENGYGEVSIYEPRHLEGNSC